MDAVQKVGNGHPGTAMSLAPAAYLLFQKLMRHNPADPHWPGRDRFVLSCGHSSLTLYIQLYLAGYGLELDDLKALRTWGSLTPGHPEHGHTAGVETTTGPLGQGVGNAVGMAMAARRERGLFDPEPAAGESLFDHDVFVHRQRRRPRGRRERRGVVARRPPAARQPRAAVRRQQDLDRGRHQRSRSARTSPSATRPTAGTSRPSTGPTTARATTRTSRRCSRRYKAAKAETGRPSFIQLRTIIAWPAPNAAEHRQGPRLRPRRGRGRGDQEGPRLRPRPDVRGRRRRHRAHPRARSSAARPSRPSGRSEFDAWAAKAGDRKALFDRMRTRTLPDGWADALPTFDADEKGMATRVASGEIAHRDRAECCPSCGAARPTSPGPTTPRPRASRASSRPSTPRKKFTGDWYGRVLHFGIREHAMGSILNGIALHGGTRPYGGTFLVFSDYMRPAVRLAALMELPVTYVWTHDSIGLGEDGPTHQPIEHLAALRAIPGLDVVRPADANETVGRVADDPRAHRPAGRPRADPAERADVPARHRRLRRHLRTSPRGAYVLLDVDGGAPDVVLIGTGSEVQIAVAAREQLADEGIRARVVSMPCREWFEEQDKAYRDTRHPADRQGAGLRRGRRRAGLARDRRRLRPHRLASSTSARPPTTSASTTEFGLTAEAVAPGRQGQHRRRRRRG